MLPGVMVSAGPDARELLGTSLLHLVPGPQDAVIKASPEPLRDDATLLVIAPHR
jgi:hypothetical protein